jgi:hypothetical protein
MDFSRNLRIVVAIGALCVSAAGQRKDAPAGKIEGTPLRATPADYQAHAEAGTVAIGAEFLGHSVPVSEGILTTEDYVVVEVGLFGPTDSKLKVAYDDFSIRINGKKSPSPSQPYEMVYKSLKDPDWEPPTPPEGKKSKTGFGTGGKGGDEGNGPPPVVHVPIGIQRAMEARTQKAALLEGERPLPQAGLLFFSYRGKVQGIHSVELIYTGPAGKATLTLQ